MSAVIKRNGKEMVGGLMVNNLPPWVTAVANLGETTTVVFDQHMLPPEGVRLSLSGNGIEIFFNPTIDESSVLLRRGQSIKLETIGSETSYEISRRETKRK